MQQPGVDSTYQAADSRKRQFEGDYAAAKKHARGDTEGKDDSDQLVCRILAESKLCGGLIGKGGKQITQIRTDSGAQIEVKKPVPNSSTRLIRVCGSFSKTMDAVKLIAKRLAEVAAESQSRQDASTSSSSETPAEKPSSADAEQREMELVLLIPMPQIGALIGKSGCNIAATRADSGAHVKVATDALPNSSEKTVTVSGVLANICVAVERILTQVHQCPEAGEAKQPYDPNAFSGPRGGGGGFGGNYGGGGGFGNGGGGYGNGGGGYGSGGGGFGGGYGGGGYGNGGGYGGGFRQNGGGGFNNGFGGNSGGGGYGDASGQYGGGNQYGGGYGQGGGQYGGGYGQGGGQYGQNSGYGAQGGGRPAALSGGRNANLPEPNIPNNTGNDVVVVPYPVSKSLIGAIIGRGGNNISAIRQRSGANVRIEEPVDGSDERMITITGTSQTIRTAISMIQHHLQNP